MKLRSYNIGARGCECILIETMTGFYVCEVRRCSDESLRRFTQRARSVRAALEAAAALMTTEVVNSDLATQFGRR